MRKSTSICSPRSWEDSAAAGEPRRATRATAMRIAVSGFLSSCARPRATVCHASSSSVSCSRLRCASSSAVIRLNWRTRSRSSSVGSSSPPSSGMRTDRSPAATCSMPRASRSTGLERARPRATAAATRNAADAPTAARSAQGASRARERRASSACRRSTRACDSSRESAGSRAAFCARSSSGSSRPSERESILESPKPTTRPPPASGKRPAASITGRRFRRRLLAVMLAAGLLPLAGGGLVVGFGLSRMLSLSLGRLDPLLERAQKAARDPALSRELSQARVDLLQAELARRSLARLAPWALLAAVGASAALLAAAAVALGRALSRPVERLARGMLQVAGGDLSVRVPEEGGEDELRLLVRQFNRMTAELEAQRTRLQLTEELAAWQTVARGLAHELKNPLTARRMAVARVARLGSPPATESAQLLGEQIDVLLRMTESFSQFARLPAPRKVPVDLAELLRETSTLYSGGSPVPIECVTDPLLLDGDADQLRRAFGNLIKNALEASRPGDGPVEIEAREHAGKARVLVRDRGAGIRARLDGAQLLRSLGTTKPQGSGLGLPIAQKIVHDHGGTLVLEPREGRGAQAIVELPLSFTPGTPP